MIRARSVSLLNTIYDALVQEFKLRDIYIIPNITERLSASIGSHILNLVNLDKHYFYHAGTLANFRNHVVFIAPSGWGKSIYFRSILPPETGFLSGAQVLITSSVRQTFSIESWMGTKVKSSDGEIEDTEGVFGRYKRGIIGADDYQRIKVMFNGEGISHDEIYLMTALDTNKATKDLAYGGIEIGGIGLTLWVGMRPTTLTLTSGLARRFTFQRFFPTRAEAKIFRNIARKQIRTKISERLKKHHSKVAEVLQSVYMQIDEVGAKKIDYSEINNFLDELDVPHFEEQIYRRLAVGMAVAEGNYPDIKLSAHVKSLISDELDARDSIRASMWSDVMRHILNGEEEHSMKLSDMKRFLMRYYQLTEDEVRHVLVEVKMKGTVVYRKKNGTKYVELRGGV